jgi:hypothetical protein
MGWKLEEVAQESRLRKWGGCEKVKRRKVIDPRKSNGSSAEYNQVNGIGASLGLVRSDGGQIRKG